jgi:hypothetical protein
MRTGGKEMTNKTAIGISHPPSKLSTLIGSAIAR